MFLRVFKTFLYLWFLSVSFTDNGFLTQYNGSYTIEVRSKINAVQMSTLHTCTKNHPAHEKLDIDVPKLYEGQFIRKYSKNVDFLRPEYWREIRIGLTGKLLNCVQCTCVLIYFKTIILFGSFYSLFVDLFKDEMSLHCIYRDLFPKSNIMCFI